MENSSGCQKAPLETPFGKPGVVRDLSGNIS